MKKMTSLLSVLLTTSLAHAHGPDDYPAWPGMMGWSHGTGWFMHALMVAAWIVVVVAIIAIFRWWVQSKYEKSERDDPKDSAMNILKRRYAKGEIDKAEFEEKKRVIEQ
ncbi:MAG: SHOCT domain-containing protein [Thermodesulfobacteriota bacterium]